MGSFADALEIAVLEHSFGKRHHATNTPMSPTMWWIGLMNAGPSDPGGGSEVATGNYARIPATNLPSWWTAATKSTGSWSHVQNATTFSSTNFNVPIGTIAAIAFFPSQTGGSLMAWQPIATPFHMASGQQLLLNPGDLRVYLD